MNLLILTNNETEVDGLTEHFDQWDHYSLADAKISHKDTTTTAAVEGTPITEYDAVYLNPEPRAAIYAKTFLETIQDHHIQTNMDSTALFLMMKRHYLFHVLHQRDVNIPQTIAFSTEKALTEIEDDIEFPAVAKMYEQFTSAGMKTIDDSDDLHSFAQSANHEENVIILQEYVDGDVYDVLYIDGDLVSLELEGDAWHLDNNDKIQYSKLSTEQSKAVNETAQAIGTKMCRVRLIGNTIVGVENEPRLDLFQEHSGKNVYGKVADMLRGDDD
ncbi:MAG: hypothetical protein MUP66_00320 [Candidatus Nanohaloarchaeota archaeon QJJ-5]|nr:hypothetical protein [Candidatus Nanohaloarchaeota archaeon QJJ-5]